MPDTIATFSWDMEYLVPGHPERTYTRDCGDLYVKTDGSIYFSVGDDHYDGEMPVAESLRLYNILKSIFEPEAKTEEPPADFGATGVIAESIEELFKGDPYAAEHIQNYMGVLSKKLL